MRLSVIRSNKIAPSPGRELVLSLPKGVEVRSTKKQFNCYILTLIFNSHPFTFLTASIKYLSSKCDKIAPCTKNPEHIKPCKLSGKIFLVSPPDVTGIHQHHILVRMFFAIVNETLKISLFKTCKSFAMN